MARSGWFETVAEAQRRAEKRLPRSVYSALLAGSERGSYQTIVSLRSDPRDAVVDWGARCSCPVGRDCKHAVAVVLSGRRARRRPARRPRGRSSSP